MDLKKISVRSLSPSEKTGWLTKQGGSFKSWKRRWFVLKGQTLYYFRTPQDTSCTGIVELSSASFVKRDQTTRKKNCFAVGTPGRTFFMFPDPESPGDTDAWIQTLYQVINRATLREQRPASAIVEPERNTEIKTPKDPPPPKLTGVRKAIYQAKSTIPFLNVEHDELKTVEFWNIWFKSNPTVEQLTEGSIIYEAIVCCSMEKISWRCSGPQNAFIQKMVDFFWSVGAPEVEIDRLNEVGANINPSLIGSWIDISCRGGMDGGWQFPVEMPLRLGLAAGDEGNSNERIQEWCMENNITKCFLVGRDMGATPPRQTEVRFLLPRGDYESQVDLARSAYESWGFEFPPEEALQVVSPDCTGGLAMSVISSGEGFVKIGLLFPKPSKQAVAELCVLSNAPLEPHLQFQSVLNVSGPEWAEFQYLNPGFGYGVYDERFGIAFHYLAGIEDAYK